MNKKKNTYQPNYAVLPGDTLKETLESLGMTQAELAQRMGRPKKTINEIAAGKAQITAETALQLEKVLGVPASFWNNLERNYQEALARLREEELLNAQVGWLKQFPVAAIVKHGWLSKAVSEVEQLKALLGFFGVAGIEGWKARWDKPSTAVSFRDSPAYQAHPAAVSAWLRKGEIEATKQKTNPYDPAAFRSALKEIRNLSVEEPEVFEPRMKASCADAGVAVVFVPELPGTHVYGATRWLKPTKALIQLSLRGKSDDHLWFTFFHEAGHILKHGKQDVFIEEKVGKCVQKSISDKENEADCFAQDFLIPAEQYRKFTKKGEFSEPTVARFAASLGISPGVIVGRLQHDGFISYSQGNNLKRRYRLVES